MIKISFQKVDYGDINFYAQWIFCNPTNVQFTTASSTQYYCIDIYYHYQVLLDFGLSNIEQQLPPNCGQSSSRLVGNARWLTRITFRYIYTGEANLIINDTNNQPTTSAIAITPELVVGSLYRILMEIRKVSAIICESCF